MTPRRRDDSLDPVVEPASDYYRADRSEMLAFVRSDAHQILEVGCGEGTFLQLLAQERPGVTAHGIEINEEAARRGREDGLHIVTGAYPDVEMPGGPYDTVLFNDVLEHIVDPWNALRVTASILAPGGEVVASLPNIRFHDTLHEIVVRGDFRYRPQGVLDITHLRFFTMDSARRMFDEAGYAVESVTGIKARRPTGRQVPFFAAATALSPSFRRESRYRQFVVRARRR